VTFPLEIRGYDKRMEPATGYETKYERAQIQKWCKLARGVTAIKRGGIKQGLGVFLKVYSWCTVITYVYCPLFLRHKDIL
jgi:hypothetical protein